MKSRLSSLQKNLQEDAALIEDPTDLFYFTGLTLSCGMLVLTKKEPMLFVDGRYIAMAKKNAPCPVTLLQENGPTLLQWLQSQHVESLSFNSAVTSYNRFEELQRSLKHIQLVPKKNMSEPFRAIKDAHELSLLKKAQALTMQGLRYVESQLKEGISEEELALEFEIFVRKHGASGLSFPPIVAFGENTAYPHHRAGKTKLAKDQIVLIDVGAIVDNYRGDLTRVVFFGNPNPILQKWLAWTQLAQKKAMDAIKTGMLVKDLDLIARSVFKEHEVEEKFSHGLGHGIGLETHEFPKLKFSGSDKDVKLSPGMVITIEPGLYEAGIGGVRWEDMVVVLENGYEKF